MYRLPYIGKPRTAGPGKNHRHQSGPKKGNRPDNLQKVRRITVGRKIREASGKCKTKTPLHWSGVLSFGVFCAFGFAAGVARAH